MKNNLGFPEKLDFKIKLAADELSALNQESQQRLNLSERSLKNFAQSQEAETTEQAKDLSTPALFSPHLSTVGFKSIQSALNQPVSNGIEIGLKEASTLLPIQTGASSEIDLDEGAGGTSDNPLQTSVFLTDEAASGVQDNVPLSGDIRIDSLAGRGDRWTTPTITYSFFDNASGPYYSSKYKGIREISDKMKGYLENILENVIEPLINVDFVKVEDTKNSYGDIRYMFSTSTNSASTTRITSSGPVAGDIRFAPKIQKDIEKGPGSYRYETLVHETLHALGLKHPGNYNGSSNGNQDGPFLANNLDNSANSILSYNRLKELDSGAITPMTNDILALQYLYGAKAHETGDTTYKFDSIHGYSIGGKYFGSKTKNLKQTIWDTAGKDTFDFSGLAFDQSGYHLDLTDGGWITTQKAYESASYKARGDGKTYKTTAVGTITPADK